ncbi:MAG: hypothetical protein KF758_14020 [Anaerolineales bacterium]|nr:hypothetical protein [Anaerolineales bacterium]MBX3038023.1 hypothetical protein [Anaerolineales bacterium]
MLISTLMPLGSLEEYGKEDNLLNVAGSYAHAAFSILSEKEKINENKKLFAYCFNDDGAC